MAPLLGQVSAYSTEPFGQHFVLTKIDTLDIHLPSLHNASAKTTTLTECFIHPWGIPRSTAYDEETHFTAKEMWQ